MSSVRIYACGGTGIGIVKKLRNLRHVKEAAVPKIVFCDTSESDMLTDFEKEDKFVLSNVDGAGKLQKEHAIPVRNAIPELLSKFKPEALNIIVCSTSGGSGPTFAIELAKRLLADNVPVILQMVVTSEDARATKNSIQTLKHLNFVATKQAVPVLVDLTMQRSASEEDRIDDLVIAKIAAMLTVASGTNVGLDTRDVSNFVFFSRVTDLEPRMLSVDIVMNDTDSLELREDIITLLEVIPADGNPCDADCLYRASGYGSSDQRITMVSHGGDFEDNIYALNERLNTLNQRTEALAKPAIQIDSEDGDDFYG